jgi:hypothetical protein
MSGKAVRGTVIKKIIFEILAVELIQSIPRADPKKTAIILKDAVNPVVRQAVGMGILVKSDTFLLGKCSQAGKDKKG